MDDVETLNVVFVFSFISKSHTKPLPAAGLLSVPLILLFGPSAAFWRKSVHFQKQNIPQCVAPENNNVLLLVDTRLVQ